MDACSTWEARPGACNGDTRIGECMTKCQVYMHMVYCILENQTHHGLLIHEANSVLARTEDDVSISRPLRHLSCGVSNSAAVNVRCDVLRIIERVTTFVRVLAARSGRYIVCLP